MASNEALEDALRSAKEVIREQQEQLDQLTANPIIHGTVLTKLDEDNVLIIAQGQLLEVKRPMGTEVNGGDIVKLSGQTMQIIDVSPAPRLGEMVVVEQVYESTVEISQGGASKLVLYDPTKLEIRKNDRIILDGTGAVVLENRGHEQLSFTGEATHVEWNDIGGLTDAKEKMKEAIELPFQHPEIFRFYNQRRTKGLLLYGPPGCGKTMLGKAAATSIRHLHGGESRADGFLYIKGPEILEKYVGVAEQRIRLLFERCRRFFEQFGFPAVLFIDEADAILPKRGSGVSSDVEKTIVPQFLSEMDGLEESGALVILATNRADTLDPAVTREGRVDHKIKIARPGPSAVQEIYKIHLTRTPFAGNISLEDMAEFAAETLFSKQIYNIRLKDGESMPFGLGDVVTGAMVEGSVRQAKSYALKRDIRDKKRRGVVKQDVEDAIEELLTQEKKRNHKEDIEEFAGPRKGQIDKIHKVV